MLNLKDRLLTNSAHLNLHDEYLPYKKVIAEVLMDKNVTVTTVINKIDDVGAHSEFRTFSYEVLAGEDNMNVEISEGNCIFRFDYSKVYWNSRLQTEHKRLVDSFNPGEVVCDVMAGVGPFAMPAGKKGVFVWANDLNPASFTSMKDAIIRNKVCFSLCCSSSCSFRDMPRRSTLLGLDLMRPPVTRHLIWSHVHLLALLKLIHTRILAKFYPRLRNSFIPSVKTATHSFNTPQTTCSN